MSAASDQFDDLAYAPLNSGAIASLALGALSPLLLVAGRDSLQGCLLLCPIPLAGLWLGLRAAAGIRRHPELSTGRRLALTGAALCAAFLVLGVAYSSYVYATEAPPGYARTSFAEFRPDDVELRGNVVVPPDVAALDGQKVFIKGYVRPDSTPYSQNISKFLLVRDNQQCCFGDISTVNYFDQVAVTMAPGKTIDKTSAVIRMGGVLQIAPENRLVGQPVFRLQADYAQ